MMRIDRVEVGPLAVNCWIVGDESGPVAVIDPGDDADLILEVLAGRSVEAIILTHAHFDHVGAVVEVASATGAPVYVHEIDAPRLTSPAADGTGGALFGFDAHVPKGADRMLRDCDEIAAGPVSFSVIHTPGHTRGGICLLAKDADGKPSHLFSGDTLFAGSVGRSDFPGGDARALAQSIASRLATLPPDTIVHPGHGPESTIGREARVNPFWPRA